MSKFLDNTGFSHFWARAKSTFLSKAEGGTVTGALSVPEPTLDAHAATKGYVDAAITEAITGAIEGAY